MGLMKLCMYQMDKFNKTKSNWQNETLKLDLTKLKFSSKLNHKENVAERGKFWIKEKHQDGEGDSTITCISPYEPQHLTPITCDTPASSLSGSLISKLPVNSDKKTYKYFSVDAKSFVEDKSAPAGTGEQTAEKGCTSNRAGQICQQNSPRTRLFSEQAVKKRQGSKSLLSEQEINKKEAKKKELISDRKEQSGDGVGVPTNFPNFRPRLFAENTTDIIPDPDESSTLYPKNIQDNSRTITGILLDKSLAEQKKLSNQIFRLEKSSEDTLCGKKYCGETLPEEIHPKKVVTEESTSRNILFNEIVCGETEDKTHSCKISNFDFISQDPSIIYFSAKDNSIKNIAKFDTAASPKTNIVFREYQPDPDSSEDQFQFNRNNLNNTSFSGNDKEEIYSRKYAEKKEGNNYFNHANENGGPSGSSSHERQDQGVYKRDSNRIGAKRSTRSNPLIKLSPLEYRSRLTIHSSPHKKYVNLSKKKSTEPSAYQTRSEFLRNSSSVHSNFTSDHLTANKLTRICEQTENRNNDNNSFEKDKKNADKVDINFGQRADQEPAQELMNTNGNNNIKESTSGDGQFIFKFDNAVVVISNGKLIKKDIHIASVKTEDNFSNNSKIAEEFKDDLKEDINFAKNFKFILKQKDEKLEKKEATGLLAINNFGDTQSCNRYLLESTKFIPVNIDAANASRSELFEINMHKNAHFNNNKKMEIFQNLEKPIDKQKENSLNPQSNIRDKGSHLQKINSLSSADHYENSAFKRYIKTRTKPNRNCYSNVEEKVKKILCNSQNDHEFPSDPIMNRLDLTSTRVHDHLDFEENSEISEKRLDEFHRLNSRNLNLSTSPSIPNKDELVMNNLKLFEREMKALNRVHMELSLV